MSDDENSEYDHRFDKFGSSSETPKNNSHFERSSGTKRSRSVESAANSKRFCSPIATTSLNNTWSANTLSSAASDNKYSANNRLKQLRDKIEASKAAETLQECFTPNSSKKNSDKSYCYGSQKSDANLNVPSASTNKSVNNETCEKNESILKSFVSPVLLQNDINTSEEKSNCGDQIQISPALPATPISIYKNIDRWATPTNKTSKRSLANERLQRLKQHINTSDKDIIHSVNIGDNNSTVALNNLENKNNVNEESSHISPLLRGLKRSADSEITPDCSATKKIAIEPKPEQYFKQPRCMRLVQSALCKDKLASFDLNFDKRKPTAIVSTSQISGRPKLKSTSNTYMKKTNGENIESKTSKLNLMGQLNRTPASLSFSNEDSVKPSSSATTQIKPESEYQEKMKMTATWVASNHLVANAHYDPFFDTPSVQKSPVVQTTVESNTIPNETEDMEWTNAEPVQGTDEDAEENKNDGTEVLEKDETEDKSNTTIQKDPDKIQALCIVVDTNIFIKNLSKLKDILDMKVSGSIQPILYIPWMVVTELDYMKDSLCSIEKLKTDVMNSIKFINKYLNEKHERFVAQTVFEVTDQKLVGTSADDKIMSCCFQVREKYESVILLSNDLNLKNKLMINGIEACSSNEIIMRIISKLTKNVKYQKIHHKMSMLCSSIICDFAKKTYGEHWNKMSMFKCPPWSLIECLKRFKRYWDTIFKDRLLKQFTKALDDSLIWLKNHRHISDDSEEFTKFVKLCITLCIHLRDLEGCVHTVHKTLGEITKIG